MADDSNETGEDQTREDETDEEQDRQENAGGDDRTEREVVTEGSFEREVDLSRDEVAAFLRDLADQIDEGTDLTVGRDDWEVQFTFEEPVEVEVELEEEDDERELEIELEFEE